MKGEAEPISISLDHGRMNPGNPCQKENPDYDLISSFRECWQQLISLRPKSASPYSAHCSDQMLINIPIRISRVEPSDSIRSFIVAEMLNAIKMGWISSLNMMIESAVGWNGLIVIKWRIQLQSQSSEHT